MRACRACGHPLEPAAEVTRCPGCGRGVDGPADWRTDTAERPRVAPVDGEPVRPVRSWTLPGREPRLPPSATEPPPPARYPLWADEVADWVGAPAPQASDPPPVVPAQPLAVPAEDAPPHVATWSYVRSGPDIGSDRGTDGSGDWFAYAEDADLDDRSGSPLLWLTVAVLVLVVVALAWWSLGRAS